eukprot:TRINITY_DN4143_c0_g1_i1.p1 TRINITY_DN4143_c0_g1~~TRINITY_DN4143_c0_g1_i1.p1  ORF type:complete len:114 (+),score=7.27 TRINITY_DN4143_c0_g1_i1:289-630(+)
MILFDVSNLFCNMASSLTTLGKAAPFLRAGEISSLASSRIVDRIRCMKASTSLVLFEASVLIFFLLLKKKSPIKQPLQLLGWGEWIFFSLPFSSSSSPPLLFSDTSSDHLTGG